MVPVSDYVRLNRGTREVIERCWGRGGGGCGQAYRKRQAQTQISHILLPYKEQCAMASRNDKRVNDSKYIKI